MSLLSTTYKNFIKQWPEKGNGRPITDVFGTYCYSFNDCVLVAKDYSLRGLVSVHKRIFDHCLKHNKPLILFLASPKGFYRFDVSKIEGSYENDRRGVVMTNFKMDSSEKLSELSPLTPAQKML